MKENTVLEEQSIEKNNSESESTNSVLNVSEGKTTKDSLVEAPLPEVGESVLVEKKSKKKKRKRNKKASKEEKNVTNKKTTYKSDVKEETSDEHKVLVIPDTSEDVDLSSTQTIEEKLAEEARLEEERKQNEARLEKERLEELKKQEDERKEKQRLEEEKKKEETLQNKNEKNDDLDLSSIPSVVEKSKKVDRLSNTIQLKTADDTLILQRELDDELLEKRFNDGLLSRILNPYEIVERIDFYNLEKLWKPITKLIIKWAIIILPIILFLSNKLNAEAFSYARMLFTDKIWLWVRIVFLGVCTELLIYFGESLIERLCGKGGHFKKILTAESYVSLSIVVLYLIAGILLLVGFEKIGLIALIIAFVYSINLHTHVYTVVSGFNKNTAILITSIFYGILVALLLYFFRLSGEDMIQIMRVFFN